MYFVICAGGTAGHINPALAVADELKKAGHEILFVGTPDHIESRLAQEAGLVFFPIEAAGFDKAHPWTLITSSMKVRSATGKIKALFKEKRPDAVLSFGAYVSIAVGNAAASYNIPLIIHEQNSVPGMANKYLARKADFVALTYEHSKQFIQAKKDCEVLGNPVRASFEQGSKEAGRTRYNIPKDATVMLVCGGSLGAQHINKAICSLKDKLFAVDNLYIVHSTGQRDYDSVCEQLKLSQEQEKRWKVIPYIDAMADVLHAADFVISRAGASSLAEIMTVGIPSVLVPFPYARGNHQEYNAASCVEAGAAILVLDKDVESKNFAHTVLELATNKDKRAKMAAACKQFCGSDARVRLTHIALSYGEKGKYAN